MVDFFSIDCPIGELCLIMLGFEKEKRVPKQYLIEPVLFDPD